MNKTNCSGTSENYNIIVTNQQEAPSGVMLFITPCPIKDDLRINCSTKRKNIKFYTIFGELIYLCKANHTD